MPCSQEQNSGCSRRITASFDGERLFWRWQPEQRGPLQQGLALVAEVVKNCGGRRAQLFNIAGNNRFISECHPTRLHLALKLNQLRGPGLSRIAQPRVCGWVVPMGRENVRDHRGGGRGCDSCPVVPAPCGRVRACVPVTFRRCHKYEQADEPVCAKSSAGTRRNQRIQIRLPLLAFAGRNAGRSHSAF